MRALSFLVPTASLFLLSIAAITACSSTDASVTSSDAGGDAPAPAKEAGALPEDDAGGDAGADAHEAGPTGPTVALPAAADQLGSALCDFYQRCFTPYITEHTGTLASCKSGASVAVRGGYPPDALFDKAAFDAATTCLATISCDAVYGGKYLFQCAPPKPLDAVAVGAECNQNAYCASSLCNGKTDTACGTCAATTTVKIGDACDEAAGTICPENALCTGKCVQVQALGDACDGDFTSGTHACGSGLKCVATKCEKAGALGATCTSSSDCDPFQTQVCDKAAGQCVALGFLDANAACDTTDFTHDCGKGLRCIAPMGSSAGTCQPAVQPSQACVRSSDCVFGYNCRVGLCTAAGSDLPVCK